MMAEVVMGSKHEKILLFLDSEIIRLRRLGKAGVLGGTGVMVLHMFYRMWSG